MSRERREKKRFQAALNDPVHYYRPNHKDRSQACSSFSFDWKPGQKEKFFKNGGVAKESPLNGSSETSSGAKPAVS